MLNAVDDSEEKDGLGTRLCSEQVVDDDEDDCGEGDSEEWEESDE